MCVRVCTCLPQILGLAIVVVSGITLARSGDKEIDMTGVQSVQNAAATAMFLGCLLLIVGFLGCCGSIRESPIMLTVVSCQELVLDKVGRTTVYLDGRRYWLGTKN